MMYSKSFSPAESIGFQKLMDELKKSLEIYGFIPHSTSSIVDAQLMREQTGIQEVYGISDPTGNLVNMGLRVDHTVCLMQFLERNKDRIIFPFKRYTTQKVFRPLGENGFREFNSCDIDVVSDAPLCLTYDAEIVALICRALGNIGLAPSDRPLFQIQVNNRGMVNGYLRQIGLSAEQIPEVREILDQGDLHSLNSLVNHSQAEELRGLFELRDSDSEAVFDYLKSFLKDDERGIKGLEELRSVYESAMKLGVSSSVLHVNPCMTRKMSYYTGTVIKTHLTGHQGGSVCHGGRYVYDGFNGVGVTFHLPHLFSYLSTHEYFDFKSSTLADVMVSGIGSIEHAMYISTRLRDDGIRVEMFLDQGMKLEEQIQYAQKRGFRLFVWTEEAADRGLKADDIVMVRDLAIPAGPMRHVCWGLFNCIKTALCIKH